jgi:hypothetical protein
LEIVIQLGVPNALQEYPGVVVTLIVLVAPVIDSGFTVKVHAVPALCVTTNARSRKAAGRRSQARDMCDG